MVGNGIAQVEAAGSGGSDRVDSCSAAVGWFVRVDPVLVDVVKVVGGVIGEVTVEDVGNEFFDIDRFG